jgi:hypothetical protein
MVKCEAGPAAIEQRSGQEGFANSSIFPSQTLENAMPVAGPEPDGKGQTQNRENNPMQSRMAPKKKIEVASQPNLIML